MLVGWDEIEGEGDGGAVGAGGERGGEGGVGGRDGVGDDDFGFVGAVFLDCVRGEGGDFEGEVGLEGVAVFDGGDFDGVVGGGRDGGGQGDGDGLGGGLAGEYGGCCVGAL